jgi:hypothetical protein
MITNLMAQSLDDNFTVRRKNSTLKNNNSSTSLANKEMEQINLTN